MFNVQQNNFQERSIESQVVSDYSDYREVSALYLPWREPATQYESELAVGERKKAITGMSIIIALGVIVTVICVTSFRLLIIPFGLAMIIGGIIGLVKSVKRRGQVCEATIVNIKEIYVRNSSNKHMKREQCATLIVDEPEKLIVRSFRINRQYMDEIREGDRVLLSYNVSVTINPIR